MQDIWARIDDWLRGNVPELLTTLQPGATEAQIRDLEEHLSIQLPEDVKASHRIHYGQLP